MKKVLILFLVLICMLSLTACDKATGSGEPVTGGAVSDMPEIDKNVPGETEAPLQAIVESISGTITRIDEDKIYDLTGEEILEIQQFRMTKVFDSEFELDYQNHYIMALENVEVKGIPIDSIEYNRVLNYELVRVHAAVHAQNEEWVLVSYLTFDGGDDIGWVKVSDLTEYTNDTKEKLLFPVTVSADCKDIDTGEKVDDNDWKITSIEGEIITITKVGGIDRKVKLEDIVYPDTFKAAE
jgi:predicted small secreted protein